ncbi:MAG TPA: hypothetical protein VJI13_03700 [Candidatus Norongarragalinales archaeon]|nr:hypothetical protein [Candidatus Norongarragalinales archaeon]
MLSKKRAQTSFEYIMIIGGAILFTVIVVVIIRSGILSGEGGKIANDTEKLSDCYLRPGVIFFENFDNGDVGRWEIMSGVWNFQNQKLMKSNSGTIRIRNTLFDNFTVELNMKNSSHLKSRKMGITFHSDKDASFYSSVMLEVIGTTSIISFYDGESMIEAYMIPHSVFGNELRLKVTVSGKSVKAYLNGGTTPVMDHVIDENWFYGKGYLGIRTQGGGAPPNDARLEFDNLCIYK